MHLFLSISQRYILKANHNTMMVEDINGDVFINKSKIHFESKSQRNGSNRTTLQSFYQ